MVRVPVRVENLDPLLPEQSLQGPNVRQVMSQVKVLREMKSLEGTRAERRRPLEQ
jgi:hypothetical protein